MKTAAEHERTATEARREGWISLAIGVLGLAFAAVTAATSEVLSLVIVALSAFNVLRGLYLVIRAPILTARTDMRVGIIGNYLMAAGSVIVVIFVLLGVIDPRGSKLIVVVLFGLAAIFCLQHARSLRQQLSLPPLDPTAHAADSQGVSAADPRLARRWERLLAWVLDGFAFGLIWLPFYPLLMDRGPMRVFWWISVFVVGMVMVFFLLAWCDGSGQTPGKWLLGTRVVDVDSGGPIGFRRGMLRRLAYIGGYLCLLLGWLWLLWDPRRQAWHDKAADSLVIRTRESSA